MVNLKYTDVTIVIPTTGRRPSLHAAIASALGQVPEPYCVLVIEDSHTGTARSVVNRFADDRVAWLRNERSHGPAGTRNFGLAAASTPLVSFLDDDDTYEPGFVVRSLETWNKAPPETIATWTGIIEEFEDGGEVRLGAWTPVGATAHDRFVDAATYHRFGTGHGLTVARERFLALGGFNEALRVAEDVDALFRILLAGPVATTAGCLVRVRRHGNDRASDDPEAYAEAFDYFAHEYGYRLGATSVARHALERARMRWHMLAGHRQIGSRIIAALMRFGPVPMRLKAAAMFGVLLLDLDPRALRRRLSRM